jgi:hypothetical protein
MGAAFFSDDYFIVYALGDLFEWIGNGRAAGLVDL